MGSNKELRVGDKVRLKKLDEAWMVSQESALIVKHVGEFPSHSVSYGALCVWLGSRGRTHEKVYPLEELIPA